MSEDTYKTIVAPSEGIYTEKRSKFIAIALPVRTVEEVKAHLETYQKKYYDARHVCYAYMLGHERKDFRANDNEFLVNDYLVRDSMQLPDLLIPEG